MTTTAENLTPVEAIVQDIAREMYSEEEQPSMELIRQVLDLLDFTKYFTTLCDLNPVGDDELHTITNDYLEAQIPDEDEQYHNPLFHKTLMAVLFAALMCHTSYKERHTEEPVEEHDGGETAIQDE